MKYIALLQASAAAAPLHRALLSAWASAPAAGCTALAVNLVVAGAEASPWDAVVEFWCHPTPVEAPVLPASVRGLVGRAAMFRVTELPGKDVGPARGWPTPGPKLIVPWIGRRDVSPAEQRRHWDEHVPLANRVHVGASRYVRNWVDAQLSADAPPYRGIASQHFPTAADLQERLFDSPASVHLIADDVAEFIAEHVLLRTTEYFVAAAGRQSS